MVGGNQSDTFFYITKYIVAHSNFGWVFLLTRIYHIDPECINKIKQLYSELSFPERFDRYEDDTYNAIKQQIHQLLPSSKHLQRIMIETMDRTFNHT